MVCQSVRCQMASPLLSARGLPINLEELESANKVLMFNPEENGPAGRAKGGEGGMISLMPTSSSPLHRRRCPLTAHCPLLSPTNGQSHTPIANPPSGPIPRSNLLLSFDVLPKFECTSINLQSPHPSECPAFGPTVYVMELGKVSNTRVTESVR